MSSSFEDILLSPQFTFLIGKEKKTVVVHANAIAATCKQMAVLINGHMNEANTRCAEIENVEVEDFVRFCEYAYRGDFTVPAWKQDEASGADGDNPDVPPLSDDQALEIVEDQPTRDSIAIPEPEPVVLSEPANGWGEWGVPMKKNKSRRLKLGAIFENHIYKFDHGDDPKAKIQARFSPNANDAANQDFTPVFLAYARLYTFAHFRSIEPLKTLTLQKLHSTLKGFNLYHSRVGDIIKLAEYAYTADDLPSRGADGTVNPLRQLVIEYIAYQINIVGKRREFVELMEEGGEFVGDFWGITMKYLI